MHTPVINQDFQKFSQGLAIKKVIVIAGRLVNVVIG